MVAVVNDSEIIRQSLLDEHNGNLRTAFEDACGRLAILLENGGHPKAPPTNPDQFKLPLAASGATLAANPDSTIR